MERTFFKKATAFMLTMVLVMGSLVFTAPTPVAAAITPSRDVLLYVNDLYIPVMDSHKIDGNDLWVVADGVANDFRLNIFRLLDGSGFVMKNDYYEMTALYGDKNIKVRRVAEMFTITYDMNGGTATTLPTETNRGKNDTFIAATDADNGFQAPLEKMNHVFDTWNTKADGTGISYAPGAQVTMSAENVVLYAIWAPGNAYAVTYDMNGGSADSLPTETEKLEGAKFLLATETGRNFQPPQATPNNIFKGWNTQANGQGTSYGAGEEFIMPAQGVTFYAVWGAPESQVTYNSNDGSNAEITQTIPEGSTQFAAAKADTFEHASGHLFKEWNTQSDGNGTTYSPWVATAPPLGNTTLYAIWYDPSTADGTANKPWVVANETDLRDVGMSGAIDPTRSGWKLTSHYWMSADINMTADSDNTKFPPIGGNTTSASDANTFIGTFDGRGHVISNLLINETDTTKNYIGLFGYVGSANSANGPAGAVKNLGVKDSSISGAKQIIGGIAGAVRSNNSTAANANFPPVVENCFVINTTVTGPSNYVGGIAGQVDRSGIVRNCYSNATVTGLHQVGGIVGRVEGNQLPKVENCYFAGRVIETQTGTGKNNIGGIVGTGSKTLTLKNNIALNEKIEYAGSNYVNANRIVGGGLTVDSVSSNNYAFGVMKLNNSFVTWPTTVDTLAGIGQPGRRILQKDFWAGNNTDDGLGWDFNAIWEWDNTGVNAPRLRNFKSNANDTTWPNHVLSDVVVYPLSAIGAADNNLALESVVGIEAASDITEETTIVATTAPYKEGEMDYILLGTLVDIYNWVHGEGSASMSGAQTTQQVPAQHTVARPTMSVYRMDVTLNVDPYNIDRIKTVVSGSTEGIVYTNNIVEGGSSRDISYFIPNLNENDEVMVWIQSGVPEDLFHSSNYVNNTGYRWVPAAKPGYVTDASFVGGPNNDVSYTGFSGAGFVGSIGSMPENDSTDPTWIKVRVKPANGSPMYEFKTRGQTQAGQFGFGSSSYNGQNFEKVIPPTTGLRLESTFENISVYYDDPLVDVPHFDWAPVDSNIKVTTKLSIPVATNHTLEYRELPSGDWKEGLRLTYDSATNGGNFRGSIVGLKQDTEYEVRLTLENKAPVTETIKTWKEDVPVGTVIDVATLYTQDMYDAGLPLSLHGMQGTPNNWIKIHNPSGIVIRATEEFNDAVVLGASEYVILDGLKIQGGLRYSLNVNSSANNIRISNCDMSYFGRKGTQYLDAYGGATGGNGRELNYDRRTGGHFTGNARLINQDAALRISDVHNLVIEKNYIHDQKGSSNPWGYGSEVPGFTNKHPWGTSGFYMRGGKGVVIRYNDIIGSNDNYLCYGISTYNNFAVDGGAGRDADVYGNYVMNANADGLELDGASQNVRVYGNRIEGANQPISIDGSIVGPVYIFRNLILNLGDQYEYTVGGIKHGRASSNVGANWIGHRGFDHVFNNTIILPATNPMGGVTGASELPFAARTGLFNKSYYRNNIVEVAGANVMGLASSHGQPGASYDYNLTNGNRSYNMFQGSGAAPAEVSGANDIIGKATFENSFAGDMRLTAESLGVDKGELLPNFNNYVTDGKPDMGALERGGDNLIPFRPVTLRSETGYQLTFDGSGTQTLTIKANELNGGNIDFEVLQHTAMKFFTVSSSSQTFTPNGEVTFTVTADETKIARDLRGNQYPIGRGTFLIKLEDGNSVPITVIVNNKTYVPATSLTLNYSEKDLKVGAAVSLLAKVEPLNATNKTNVVWTSSNENVAKVDSTGRVTAMAPGTAKITASLDGIEAQCDIRVAGFEGEIITNVTIFQGSGSGKRINMNFNLTGGQPVKNPDITVTQLEGNNPGKIIGSQSGDIHANAWQATNTWLWRPDTNRMPEGLYSIEIVAYLGNTTEIFTAMVRVTLVGATLECSLYNEHWRTIHPEPVLFGKREGVGTDVLASRTFRLETASNRFHISNFLPIGAAASTIVSPIDGVPFSGAQVLRDFPHADGYWVWSSQNNAALFPQGQYKGVQTAKLGGITEVWDFVFEMDESLFPTTSPLNMPPLVSSSITTTYDDLFTAQPSHYTTGAATEFQYTSGAATEFVIDFNVVPVAELTDIQNSVYSTVRQYNTINHITPEYSVLRNGVPIELANTSLELDGATGVGKVTVALDTPLTETDVIEYMMKAPFDENALVTHTYKQEIKTGWYTETPANAEFSVIVPTMKNGTITVDKNSAATGNTVTLTAITPSQGYRLVAGSLKVNNGAVALNADHTFTMPQGIAIVTAEFEPDAYYVNVVTPLGGTVTVSNDLAMPNETVIVNLAPEPGYAYVDESLKVSVGINDISVDQVIEGTEYSFAMPETNVTITVRFEPIQAKTYTATIIPAANGIITTNKSAYEAGETVILTIVPEDGYRLKAGSLKYNETVIEGNTFVMPNTDVTIAAVFEYAGPPEPQACRTQQELQARIDNAKPSDVVTIEIADNMVLESPIVINKNLNLTLTAKSPITITSATAKRHFESSGNVTLSLQNIRLEGNKNGGGILHKGTLVFMQGEIYNAQNDNGGAFYVTGVLDLRGGTIDSNKATTNGGGAFVDGTIYINNVNIRNNIAGKKGGAVFVSNYYYQSGGVLENNTAQEGGGAYVEKAAFISGGVFQQNTALYDGGGLYVRSDASNVINIVSLSSGSFVGNQAKNGNGGGLYIATTSQNANNNILLTAGSFANNSAMVGGGAIYITKLTNNTNPVVVTVKNIFVSNNTADYGGGIGMMGFSRASMTLNLQGGSITKNTANVYGGGIYSSNGTINVNGESKIQYNQSLGNGGAMYISGTNLNINNDYITNNVAVELNGGIFANTKTACKIVGEERVTNNYDKNNLSPQSK